MRVLFISDFTLEQRAGGAQVSNDLIIKKGRELGHEIIEHDHTSSVIDFLSHYDVVISSNLEIISTTSRHKLPFIVKHPSHVRLEHDSCSYLNPTIRRELFESSRQNFFLSQFHISFFRELYGDYFNNVEIVYDPIDSDIFRPTDVKKKYDVVYCGYIHPLKGVKNLIDFAKEHPNRQVSVFGWGDNNFEKSFFNNCDNVSFHGSKTPLEVAEIFQQARAVYHKPMVNEPFCRMVGEALLCGVEEIIGATEKIGAFLELKRVGMDIFRKGCHEASQTFWEKIDV